MQEKPKLVSVQRYQEENSTSEKPTLVSVKKYQDSKPEQQKSNTTVGQDILQSILDVPSVAYNAVKSIPSEAYGAVNQLATDPSRFLRNVGAAMIEPGKAVANLPSNVANYLASKNIISPQTAKKIPRSPLDKVNIPEWVGVKGQQSGDALLQGAGYAPFGMAGELGELGVIGRGAARAGASGAYSAGENQNPLTAALAGQAIAAPFQGAIKGASAINSLRPSVRYSGNLSNDELASNLRAAEGTNALLGDVLGSPKLKKFYEDKVSPVWGSGSDELYKTIVDQLQDKGESFLSDLASKSRIKESGLSDNDYIKKVLEKSKKKHADVKNKLYDQLNELSKEQDFSPDLSSFIGKAAEINYDLSTSPIAPLIKGRKKIIGETEGFKKSNQIVDEFGNPLKNRNGEELNKVSLSDAMNLKSDLYNKAINLLKSSSGADKNLGYDYINLYKTLRNDINSSVAKASPELKRAYESANQYYSDNFSRFLDKDIKNYFSEETAPDAVVRKIINPSRKNDKIANLSKIMDILPEEEKGAFAHAYLKNAVDKKGNLDIGQMSSLLDELGTNQFKTLFKDEESRQKALDFMKLKQLSSDPLQRMFNPKTGYRSGNPFLSTILAALGGGGGALHGGAEGAIVGALAGSYLPSLASKQITRYVSSPKVRESLVKKIMENQSAKNNYSDYLKNLINYGKIASPALTVNEQKEGK